MIEGMTITRALSLAAINIIEIYGVFLVQATYFEFREKMEDKKKLYYLTLGALFVISYFVNLLGIIAINTVMSLSLFFVPCLLFLKLNNLKGYICFVFEFLGSVVSELITVAFVQTVPVDRTDYSVFDSPFTFLITALIKLLLIILICSFGKKNDPARKNNLIWIFLLVPFSSLAVYYFCYVGRLLPERIFGLIGSVTGILLLIANVALFLGLDKFEKTFTEAIELKEHALKLESESDILEVAAKSMKEKLSAAENMVERDRLMRHDRRHFEGLILSLLQEGNTEEAKKLLEERLNTEPKRSRKWCANPSVNATLDYYISKAEENDITVNIEANIPDNLSVDDLDLAIAIGNLFENAINACGAVTNNARYINLSAKYKSQLLLEIENPYAGEVKLDDKGYPITDENGHGVGTKSVLAFVDKSGSQIFYNVSDNKFRVRLIVG